MLFRQYVTRVIEADHSNGPEGGPCFERHGHSFEIKVETRYAELDQYGWGPPFGVIKGIISRYNGTFLNEVLNLKGKLLPPSAENLARVIFHEVWGAIGHRPYSVVVTENNNVVEYTE